MLLNLIPPQYRLLAALGAAVALLAAGAWTGHTWTERRWEAAVARQEAEAARMEAASIERNRAKEAQDAENARRIDESHAAELASIRATADDFAERLRIARRGARCPSPGATQADNPGVSAEPAGSSDNGSGQPDPGNRLRAAVKELQAYAVACHSWSLEVGR